MSNPVELIEQIDRDAAGLIEQLAQFRAAWPRIRDRYVVDERGCWLWQGAATALGYPQIRVDGKTLFVHRIMASVHTEGLPAGYHVDHLCRTPRCINPVHLDPVPPAENIRRGRLGVLKERCGQGHSWTPDNILTKGDGTRRCRLCHREWERKRRERGK